MSNSQNISRFNGENVISLETYRRNGQPVRTPVWFLLENGVIYVHTDDRTGKVKRIRRNPRVRVAPSHFRGKPKADYADAIAELETNPVTVQDYRSRIYKKYGIMGTLTTFMQRLSRNKAEDVVIRVRLTG